MSLACLWQSQGQIAQAGELLSPIAEWFGGHLETLDLREARFLLESLDKQAGKQFLNVSDMQIGPGLTPS
jgi:hypothetical protein